MRGLVKTLCENAGLDGDVVLDKLAAEQDPYRGFDVLRSEVCDLKERSILTPRDTEETIIAVATETAASLWTTGAAVLEK